MKRHWRTLAELEHDAAFLARAAQEFPGIAEALANPVGRRRTLQLLAASLALGGLAGCGSPGTAFDQMTVSPVAPPDIIPALPNYYATVSVFNGYADGVVVKPVMGRPIKVEGNPKHPASLGATDVHGQAMLLDFTIRAPPPLRRPVRRPTGRRWRQRWSPSAAGSPPATAPAFAF